MTHFTGRYLLYAFTAAHTSASVIGIFQHLKSSQNITGIRTPLKNRKRSAEDFTLSDHPGNKVHIPNPQALIYILRQYHFPRLLGQIL